MASTEQVLRAFILDYLAKRGFVSAAEGLRADHLQKGENPIGPPAIDVQNSFLLEFFAPFWDVFSARCRRANKRPQQQQPEANLDPSVALQQNLFANRRSPQTFRQLPNNQQQTSQQQQTQQHQLQHQQQHPQHQTSQQQQQQQHHHQHQQRQLLRQQQILQSRNRDRQNLQNQAIHSLSLDSLQKPDLTHNPTQLTNDMIDVNGAFDGFLSTVNTRPQQTRHQQTSARQQLMSQVPRHSTPQQTLPMRQQNKRYQNIPVIGSEAPSSASRRTAMDVQTANQPFDDTVEEDSAPRPQNTQHQKKRPATQTLSRKSPASSPSSALSPPVPFPDAAPAKRQRPSAPFQQPVNSVIHPLQQHHQKLSGVDIEGMSRSFQQAQSVKRNRNAHLLALQQHQQRQQQHAFAQAQQAQGDRQNMPFVSAQLPTQPTQQSQQTGPNPDKMLQRGAVRFPGRTANVSQAFLGQEHMSKRQQEAFHHAQTNGRRQQGQVTGDTAKGPDGKPVGAPFRIGEPGFTMNQGPPGTPTQATQQAAGTTRPSGAGTVPGQPGTGAEKATGALGTPGAPETPGAATTPNAAAQQFGLPPNTFQMPHQGLYMMDGQMRLYQSNPNQLLPNNLIPQNAQVKKGGHESATPSANGKSGNDAGNSKQLEAQMEAQRMFEGAALKDNSANHRRQQSLKAGMPLADHDRRLKDKKSKNGDRSGATKGSQAQSATDRKMATSGAMKTIETSRGGSRRGTATDNAATKAANMRATNSSSPNGLGIATAATGRAGKQSGDVEVDIRSAKSDRQAAASRGGGTPSQKSTASGGSGAGDKRASSGSTGKRTGRARPRPRGTGNQRRTKADRTQQQSRTGSSRGGQSAVARNAAAAAAAEVKAAAAAAAASAAVATGDSARGAQGDASGPDVTTGSLLAPPTRAPGSAQAQSGKADNGGRQAVGRSFKQPEEPKLPFDTAVNGNSDNGHDESGQQHQQQQLLDMLQSGGRSGGEVGLDSMEKPFNIHQMGMVGPAKIGQTGGYGYDIQQYLTPGVGEGNDLENMLSMNSMQDNLGLEGSDFGEENILGVGDPDLGLVGRSRS